MKKKTSLVTVLIMILLLSACGNSRRNSDIPSQALYEMNPGIENPEIGNEAAIPERDWKEVYEAVLHGDNSHQISYLELVLPENNEDIHDGIQVYLGAALYDIDNNGIPELFVFVGLYEGIYYSVYTYEDNKAKFLIHSGAGSIEKSTGILFGIGGDAGYNRDEAYRYENGEFVEIPDYVETIFDETGYGATGFRLGNREFKWEPGDYDWNTDEVIHINTFFDYEDAVSDFAFGITDNKMQTTGEAPMRPFFFEDIGKPYPALIGEHPEAIVSSNNIGIPDAALVCLQVPDYDFAYILFGTQYFSWELVAKSERDKLMCAGIAATVDVIFPGIGDVIAFDDFFVAINVLEYDYFSEIGPDQGWIVFEYLNRTVFIDTGRDSRQPDGTYQPVKTIKNSYPAVIMDFGIESQNQTILNDASETETERYPEFTDMLHELRDMPCVAEVYFAIREDGYQIDITLTENTVNLNMKDLFACIQWGVAYRDGDRRVWERRLPIEALPDTVLRIYESSGGMAYDFFGSYTNPYNGEYTQYFYRWYANTWPERETAFSFLFPERRYATDQGTDVAQREIPSINGVNIFNFHEDFDFLKPYNSVNIGSHIQEVHEALGNPLAISARYGPTLDDAPYQDNFISEEYGFCSVYYARYHVAGMTFRQPGYGLMRGISIGDSYEKVLDAFPRQAELADQRGVFGGTMLYGADYEIDYYTGCMSINETGHGYIIYASGGGCIEFTVTDGIVVEFQIDYVMH